MSGGIKSEADFENVAVDPPGFGVVDAAESGPGSGFDEEMMEALGQALLDDAPDEKKEPKDASASGLECATPSTCVGSRGHEAQEKASDDEGEEVIDRPAVVEISALSDLGRLPTGTMWNAVGRIRKTINSYALAVALALWAQNFKVATVSALERRLNQYAASINTQPHVDIQVAFHQLVQRVTDLLECHKFLRHWLDSRSEDKLELVRERLLRLRAFLVHKELDLGPDAMLILMRADFFVMTQKVGLSRAFRATVDLGIATQALRMLQDASENTPGGPDAPDNVEEEDTEDGIKREDDEEAAEAGTGQPKEQGKKRNRFALLGYEETLNIWTTPFFHVASLLAHGLKMFFFSLEPFAGDAARARDLMCHLTRLEKAWDRKVVVSDEQQEFPLTLGFVSAAKVVVQTCLQDKASMPKVADARLARRFIGDTADADTDPFQQAAKAMLTYKNTAAAIAQCVSYCKAGADDEATMLLFSGALDVFEKALADLIDDPRAWTLAGNEGGPQTCTSLGDCLARSHALLVSLTMVAGRVSQGTVQDHGEELAAAFENALEVGRIAHYVMLDQAARSLQPSLLYTSRRVQAHVAPQPPAAGSAGQREATEEAAWYADAQESEVEEEASATPDTAPELGDLARLSVADLQAGSIVEGLGIRAPF